MGKFCNNFLIITSLNLILIAFQQCSERGQAQMDLQMVAQKVIVSFSHSIQQRNHLTVQRIVSLEAPVFELK